MAELSSGSIPAATDAAGKVSKAQARQIRKRERQAERAARRAEALRQRQIRLAQNPDAASGRPPKAEKELRVHAVTVRLDEAHYRKLSTYVAAGGRSGAAVLRALLDGQPLLTTEQHQRLLEVPDLVRLTEQLVRQLETQQRGAEAQQVGEWQRRLERVLESLEQLV